MSKIIHTISCLILWTSTLCGQGIQETEQIIPVKKLQEDIRFLRNKLAANHPDLYLYTTKDEMDRLFDSLSNTIGHPLTIPGFYKHIAIISSVIKDGHTIILPGDSWREQHNKNSLFLPYHFTIADGKLFVDMTCTGNSSVSDGDEILSIDGIRSAEIIKTLIDRQVRDGYNVTYPQWILNNYLRDYYSFIYGHPAQFEIAYRRDSSTHTAWINGLPKDSINYYRQSRYPGRNNDRKPNEGLKLSIDSENRYAVLTVKDFHKEILRKYYKQDFEKVIGGFFDQLNTKGTGNLILDLRNNQGGDIEFGVFLLSCLLQNPFSVVQAYLAVDNSAIDFQLKRTSGESLGIHQPRKNAFTGNVYVLINGGSFSNSGIVAACLKKNKRAIFIGEETGGNNKVLAGYPKDFSLPNSGILVEIPTRQFLLDEDAKPVGRGTMPDYLGVTSLKDLTDGSDSVLDLAIKLILKK